MKMSTVIAMLRCPVGRELGLRATGTLRQTPALQPSERAVICHSGWAGNVDPETNRVQIDQNEKMRLTRLDQQNKMEQNPRKEVSPTKSVSHVAIIFLISSSATTNLHESMWCRRSKL